MQVLGKSLSDFPEFAETAAYRQALYYAIDHDGPLALLGFFMPLEGLAAKYMKPEWRRITTLYADAMTSFLKVHLKLDVGHFDQGLKALASLAVDELTVVARNLQFSAELYVNIVERIKHRSLGSEETRRSA